MRANLSAVLPSRNQVKKLSPRAPITVKSADSCSAKEVISSAGFPNLTARST
jgi:hypothetical protein